MGPDEKSHKERGASRRSTSPDKDRERIIEWFRERLDPIAEKLDESDEESDTWRKIKTNSPIEVDKYELIQSDDGLEMPMSTFYTRSGWQHIENTLSSATYHHGYVEVDLIQYYREDYEPGSEEDGADDD